MLPALPQCSEHPPDPPAGRCGGVKPPVKQGWSLLLSLLGYLEISKFATSIRS